MADKRNIFDVHIPSLFNELRRKQPTTSIDIRVGYENKDFQVVDLADLRL